MYQFEHIFHVMLMCCLHCAKLEPDDSIRTKMWNFRFFL